MEPAKIDWKRLHSTLVMDQVYEYINAPKWVDFSAPDDDSVDDESFFCTPDCNHPKTVEDFVKGTPPSKGSAVSVSEVLPLRDRNTRDANLKKKGVTQPPTSSSKYSKIGRFIEDGENQNPNLPSTPSHQYNIMKAAIKSSTERKQIDTPTKKVETPRLRSTLSARNLFGGCDILNHITELCNELKRKVTRARERENVKKSDVKRSPVGVKKDERKECEGGDLGEVDEREKERKPLLEVSKEKCEAMEKSNLQEKPRRKKKADETENIPISVDLENVKGKEGENSVQIQKCPPSPQCFSASHGPSKAAPLKNSRSRPPAPEKGILQELEQSNRELRNERRLRKTVLLEEEVLPSLLKEKQEPWMSF